MEKRLLTDVFINAGIKLLLCYCNVFNVNFNNKDDY